MRSCRAAIACAILAFGCDVAPKAKKPASGDPNDILLEASLGLPRFKIRATFDANLDPRPHIQPVAAALAGARTICFARDSPVKPGTTAVVNLEVRGKQVHAEARNATGTCLARALDGKATDDPASYTVELLVSVG